MLCYNICRISLKQSGAVVFGAQATTAQLYLIISAFATWPGLCCSVLVQNTFLPQSPSPPRSINGW